MKSEKTGMSSIALARIPSAIKKHIGEGKLAGSVALLARRGEVVHCESYGLMDRGRNKPMIEDAIFRIYSMTKPITCVALMMLYERGRLQLFDPAAQYIPEFESLKVWNGQEGSDFGLVEPCRPVTIEHLLTHTSGITYHFLEDGPVEQMYRDSKVASQKPLGEFVRDVLQMPLAFQPGTAWRYSCSHDLLAYIIEIISGQQFDVFLRENIFEPLCMNDTGFHVPPQDVERLTALYGTIDLTDPEITASSWYESAECKGGNLIADPLSCMESRSHNTFRGGHGLVSTTEDYYKFCRMLLNQGAVGDLRLLSRKSVELMTVNHLPRKLLPYEIAGVLFPGYGYGLGFRVLMDTGQAVTLGTQGEFGWAGAAGTYFWIDPAEQMIGIRMTQFQHGDFHQISPYFRVACYQAIAD